MPPTFVLADAANCELSMDGADGANGARLGLNDCELADFMFSLIVVEEEVAAADDDDDFNDVGVPTFVVVVAAVDDEI